ncbi:MAG TPA: XRE family transcriptional regulator [Longimicrobiaceae bacterium]|jgi:Zn-dependent peptidase ImmA (M78 family)/DNA-binding XRE family transcriptional regulator
MDDFNRYRLALARERSGLTKRELARLVDCSEKSLVEWEKGTTVPTSENAVALAKALSRPVHFFYLPDPEDLPLEAVSFRSLSKLRAGDRSRALAGARMALELNDFLTENFELPQPDVPDLRHHQNKPEAAALSLRSRWSLGDKPIKNMVSLLEFKGIRVFSLAEDCRELNAFSFWHDGTPFVFLNTQKSSECSRFDAAHELAHLVLHQHGEPGGRKAELEANAFAGAFLMPVSSFATYAPRVPSIPRLIEAKKDWNVSLAALAHRMHEVGILSEWNYRSLCIEIQKAGYRVAEPDSAPREMSQVFPKVFRALHAEGIGKRELAAQLGWTVDELNALVFGLVLGSIPGGGQETLPFSSDGRERLRLVK